MVVRNDAKRVGCGHEDPPQGYSYFLHNNYIIRRLGNSVLGLLQCFSALYFSSLQNLDLQ